MEGALLRCVHWLLRTTDIRPSKRNRAQTLPEAKFLRSWFHFLATSGDSRIPNKIARLVERVGASVESTLLLIGQGYALFYDCEL